MPIVIAREGDMIPVSSAPSQERRNAAWAKIVRTWADAHSEELRSLSEQPSGSSAGAGREAHHE